MRTPAYEKKIAAVESAFQGRISVLQSAIVEDVARLLRQVNGAHDEVAKLRRLLRFYGAIAVLALIVAVVTR